MYQQLYLILTVILAVCEAEKCMHPPPSTQYSNSLYAGKECFSKNGQICFVSIFASLTYPATFGNLPVPCIQYARFSLQQKEYGILGHLTLAETVPTC